jgi:hypothetical protein
MDTIEGTIDAHLWYHYDMDNDVLYLRLASQRDVEAFGEETPDGFILLRNADNDVAGMTVVDYWRRFGEGRLQDVPLKTLSASIAARAQSLEYALAA